MSWLFSKRCKEALKDKKIKVSIPISVRIRIWKKMQERDQRWNEANETGWNYWTSTLEQLTETLKAELGINHLMAFPENGEGPAISGSLESFVLRGNYPPHLLDALELLHQMISEEDKHFFQHDLNAIMEESGLPWRMADGKIFPIDSAYLEEEILRKTYRLLHEVSYQGALEEFEKARTDLVNADYGGAIQNANLAVESAIKGLLNIDRAKPGELYRKLIDSGLVPQYFGGFLKAFEENILRCVAVIRNEELGAGHGQGSTLNKIPPRLAELAVHLAAVIINFLINLHLERQPPPASKKTAGEDPGSDTPF